MAGFSKSLVAETIEEYIAIAVRLLNDSDFARAILPRHTRDETLARFSKNKTTEERNPIADVFIQVYRRHEELKSVDEQSFISGIVAMINVTLPAIAQFRRGDTRSSTDLGYQDSIQ